MRLSATQKMLLDDLVPGVWYDVYQDQGTDGEYLPDWFHRNQTQPMATIRVLAKNQLVELRRVTELRLPQIRKT